MTFVDFIETNPASYLILGFAIIGLTTIAIVMAIAFRESGKGFWVFLLDLDASYPIRPHDRLMHSQLLTIAEDNQQATGLILGGVKESADALKKKLDGLQDDSSHEEKLEEVLKGVRALISQIDETVPAVPPSSVVSLSSATRRH